MNREVVVVVVVKKRWPMTEASVPRDDGFASSEAVYRNGLLGSQAVNATAAASTVLPQSPQTSPGLPEQQPSTTANKAIKSEKSKVKLFFETKEDSK